MSAEAYHVSLMHVWHFKNTISNLFCY